MAFPSHLREIAEYAVARKVISAAKNVEKQFKINKRCLATGRVPESTVPRRGIAL